MGRGVLRGDLIWLGAQGLLGDSTEAPRKLGSAVGLEDLKPDHVSVGRVL